MQSPQSSSAARAAIRPGLCSISFRQLSAAEVVALAAEAGLDGIEWGGDVHAPPGDAATAAEVARLTADAGLRVSSYGSYYRVGGDAPGDIGPVLATAAALAAPVVRVWAGPADLEKRTGGRFGKSSPSPADYPDLWKRAADDLNRVADLAALAGVRLGLEHHPGTFTADAAGAIQLLSRLDIAAREVVGCYWQPNQNYGDDDDARTADLAAVAPHLLHVHVFQWKQRGDETRRFPLADGESQWRRWLATAGAAPASIERFALLEFVKGDDPDQLRADAATLRRIT